MILDTLEIMDTPDDEWLTRLRAGHFVWCPKHFCFAKIQWPWTPPEPGNMNGYIGLSLCWNNNDDWGLKEIQKWYIRTDGNGFDGIPLLSPVKDNCPTEERVIPEPLVEEIKRTIAYQNHKIEKLESAINEMRMKEYLKDVKDFYDIKN